ncbi:MAG: hypothetical protein ABJB40_04740 [Acidobacteriota bacterium]
MIHSFYLRRLSIKNSSRIEDVLVIFLGSDEFDEASFVTAVTKDIRDNLEPDAVMFLVRSSSLEEVSAKFLSSRLIEQLLSVRLRDKVPIAVVAFDARGAEVKRRTFPEGTEGTSITLDSLRRPIITAIFRDRRGFVESTDTYHFENPSGKHTERFIRLSNLLHSSAEISLLAFCALPQIPEQVTVLYVDTPSFFPIVSAINDHRRSMLPGGSPLLTESFGSYEGLKDFRFDELETSFGLISASSSGSLADLLVSEHNFERKQILHFLYLGKFAEKLLIVADLSLDSEVNPEGFKDLPSKQPMSTCVLCEAGSIAIPLRGDQFEPAGPQTSPLYLKKTDAPEGLRTLIGKLAGDQVLGVGLGAKNTDQPRLYYVDPTRLIANKAYSPDLDYIVKRSSPAGAEYVICLDDGSVSMAEQVANHLGSVSKAPIIISRSELDKIPQGTISPIILVSAVIESGRSLLDISRDLRTITPEAPLSYVIGLNKTSGDEHREALLGNLSQTSGAAAHPVVAVRKIVLPPSVEDHSWGREGDILRSLTEKLPDGAEKDVLAARMGKLDDKNCILYDDLFLPSPTLQPLAIRPGFVFAWTGANIKDYSQADVFYTISSVLQRLRANSEKPGTRALRSNWFQQTVLAPDTFSRYNDGIIQASFLRAASPSELNYAERRDLSKELTRIATRILRGGRTARGEAALELLMALATGRLTLHRDDIHELTAIDGDLPQLERELLQICKLRLSRNV